MSVGTRTDPYRNCRFRVEIDQSIVSFKEVTLPDSSKDVVDYRNGDEPPYVRKLAGLTKFGNLVLKRGTVDLMELYEWRKNIEKWSDKGANNRKNISVILIDEEGEDKARWEIVNAWCSKIEYSGLNAQGNEVQIETLELVNEGIQRVK